MGNREEFLKNLKKVNIYLYIGLFFVLSAIVSGAIVFINKNKEMNDIKYLGDVNEANTYAQVNVELMTDRFATNDYSGIEHSTYFVWDDTYLYIVDLNDKTREELNAIYDYSYREDEDAEAPSPVTIKGMTKAIPSDLKKLAISSYNKLLGETFLTQSNFSEYLGVVYLDTFESPMTSLMTDLIASYGALVFAAIFLIIYFRQKYVTKKCIAKLEGKWDSVLNEMDSSDTFFYKKAKLYLTKSYLVSYQAGLEVYDFNDIVWIYPHEYRYNGSLSQKSLMIVTKNSKVHKLATVSASKKNLATFDELYNTFLNRMPNVLSGYTDENKAKAKELYQK